MNNLIIGDTSQLSSYFPADFVRISSRNIDYEFIESKKWKRAYLLFAEQRTYLKESVKFYSDCNVNHTLSVLDKICPFCDEVIVFLSADLWSCYEGPVDFSMPIKYIHSGYLESKEILYNRIQEKRRTSYSNVIFVSPFNFNTPGRNENWLFGKIYQSLLQKTKVTVDCIDFCRDFVHPSIVVKKAIETTKDCLVGSGFLVNMKDFFESIFSEKGLKIDNYVYVRNLSCKNKLYYNKEKLDTYEGLIQKHLNDII
jgi:hypothetical protein